MDNNKKESFNKSIQRLKANDEEFINRLVGRGTFKDTGRQANAGEALDSVLGAPIRAAISELQNGNIDTDALKRVLAQVGKDPKTAPTGVDIALKVTDNPFIGAGLASIIDMLQVPTPGGIMGSVKNVAKISPEAQAILSKVNTAEKAVALKGAERGEYLKALDEAYGNRASRAKDMGFGDKTQYHGTPKISRSMGFEKFKLSKAGSQSGETYGRGVYTTPDTDTASMYSEILDQHSGTPIEEASGHVYPLKINASNQFDLSKHDPAFLDKLSQTGYIPEVLKQQVKSAKSNQEAWNIMQNNMHPDQIARYLEESKFTGVAVPGMDYNTTFNPNNVRSTNAAFDPRFKDSDLLLSGKTTAPLPGVNLPQGYQLEEDKPQGYAEGGQVQQNPGDLPPGFQLENSPAPVSQVSTTQNLTGDLPPGFELEEDKYGGIGQQAISALEGAAQGALGPIAPAIERGLGVSPEAIRGRAEVNPVTHGLSEAAGLVGSFAIPVVGQANVLAKAGEGAQALAGLAKVAEGASVAHRVGSLAVAQAAEMAVYSGGDEISKFILKDPNQTAETAISNVGLATVLGGGIGAGFGTISPLWKATVGPKLEKSLTGFREYLDGGGRLKLPEEIEAAQKELGIEISPATRAGMSGDPKAKAAFNSLRENNNAEIINDIKKLEQSSADSILQSLGAEATPEVDTRAANSLFNPKIRDVADQYARERGMTLKHDIPVKLNEDRAKNIAAAYEQLKHTPDNPEVKKAYDALIDETIDQFQTLKRAGLKISSIKPGQANPYASSADMAADVTKNNHLWFYPTDQGFGTAGEEITNHPLLKATNETLDNKPLLANDIFRIVHDYFGHAKEGSTFGKLGEERAWRHHMQMYSPEAQKALTTETRGQNSWVNFGPYGESNRANPGATKYADQKAGILPAWARVVEDIKAPTRHLGIDAADIASYNEADIGNNLKSTFLKEYKQKYGPVADAFNKRDELAAVIPVSEEARLKLYGDLLEKGMSEVGTDSPFYKAYHDYGNRVLKRETIGELDQLSNEMAKTIRSMSTNNNEKAALQNIIGMISSFKEQQITGNHLLMDAGKITTDRAAVKDAYSHFRNMSDRLTKHLGVGDFKGYKALVEKLTEDRSAEQLLKAFSPKGDAEIIPFLRSHFPETFKVVQENELKKLLKPAVLSAKEGTSINVQKLASIIDKGMAGEKSYIESIISPEALAKIQAANTLSKALPPIKERVDGILGKLYKSMPASAMAAVGWLVGGGPGGAGGFLAGHLAQYIGREAPDAFKLAFLKFIASEQPVKAEGFKAMVDMVANTYKGARTLDRATSNVFKPVIKVLSESQLPTTRQLDKIDRMVAQREQSPASSLEDAHKQSDIAYYLPAHQVSIAKTSANAVTYLSSLKPRAFKGGPLDKAIEPSAQEKARYNRALEIAQQPHLVLQHMKDGSLLPSDITDIKAMYPALYNNMVMQITHKMVDRRADEEPISYKTRLGLSLFLGQPIDSSMKPESIIKAQPVPNPREAQPQQMPGGGVKHSTANIGKDTIKSSRTSVQGAEASRQSRD